MKFKPIFWLPIGVVALLVVRFLYAALNPHESKQIRTAAGELSNKQAAKIEARRDQEIKAADDLRKQSVRSADSADSLMHLANEAGKKATALRIQTHKPKPHAPVLPIPDTTADRIQREWSKLGD